MTLSLQMRALQTMIYRRLKDKPQTPSNALLREAVDLLRYFEVQINQKVHFVVVDSGAERRLRSVVDQAVPSPLTAVVREILSALDIRRELGCGQFDSDNVDSILIQRLQAAVLAAIDL